MKRSLPFPTMIVGLFLVVVLFLSATTVTGFSNGAPGSTCLTMFPKHGKEQQFSPSPFRIILSPAIYTPSQEITVVVNAQDGRFFRGIQIRAHRKSINVEDTVGTFTQWPQNKTKTLNCIGGLNNLVTHRDDSDVDSLTMKWRAPDTNVGDIVFTATVLEWYAVFWYDVQGNLRSANPNAAVLPPVQMENATTVFEEIQFDECGKTKGCFLYPQPCHGVNCDAVVTYRQDGDDYKFELFAKAEGYVSLGFSDDVMMTNDETISCTAQNNRISVQHGFNPALHNDRQIALHLRQLQVRQMDGKVFCRFTRPRVMNARGGPPKFMNMTFDLAQDWYLMIAWGYTYQDTDVMGKHVELPPVTSSKVNLREYVIHRGHAFHKAVQAHGALMMIAWMLLSSFTKVIARYYRDISPNQTLGGAKVWFQLHRAVSLAIGLLTLASFIIIFVHVNGLTEAATTHAYIGITVTCVMALQIAAGLLRPGLDSKIRPVFNWVHRFAGSATHILAGVNILLSFYIRFVPLSMRMFGTIVCAVWLAHEVLWFLIFEIRKCVKSSKTSNKYVLDDKQLQIAEDGSSDGPNLDNLLLIFYCLCTTALCVTGLCAIFLF